MCSPLIHISWSPNTLDPGALGTSRCCSAVPTLSPCHFTSQTNLLKVKVAPWVLLPVACRMPFGCECLLPSSCWMENPARRLQAILSHSVVEVDPCGAAATSSCCYWFTSLHWSPLSCTVYITSSNPLLKRLQWSNLPAGHLVSSLNAVATWASALCGNDAFICDAFRSVECLECFWEGLQRKETSDVHKSPLGGRVCPL